MKTEEPEQKVRVWQRGDYCWVVDWGWSPNPREVYHTQREAVESARWKLMNKGGGILTLEAPRNFKPRIVAENERLKEEIQELKKKIKENES